jgi:hypothetical protein
MPLMNKYDNKSYYKGNLLFIITLFFQAGFIVNNWILYLFTINKKHFSR